MLCHDFSGDKVALLRLIELKVNEFIIIAVLESNSMNYIIKPSKRSVVEPFRAMDIVAKANKLMNKGDDVIMMCVGQPFAPAPKTARDAAKAAIDNGRIGYTVANGIGPLRARIAQHYFEQHNVDIDPNRIIVTNGSSCAFTLSFLSMFEIGARVAIPAPGYPAYRNILRSLSMEAVEIDTNAQSGWVLTPQLLRTAHAQEPLDGLLIANPNNPNGTMIEANAFKELQETCAELGIKFISDEIYHGLTYGQKEISALSISDDCIVINSFSKYFCMTGWRIGWMIVPEHMVETVNRLQQNLFICASEISQIAALHAFDGVDELEITKAGYLKNRSLLLKNLPKMGLSEIMPVDGAFYCYANVEGFTQDSESFCANVLTKSKLALTPGVDFDSNNGKKWVRLSFAGSYEDMQKGLERLGNYLAN